MKDKLNFKKSIEHNFLNKDYWEDRWKSLETSWDIGYSSPAIEEYILQYPDKSAKILIPGCGNAYEVEFLWNLGFRNITVIDISPKAVHVLKDKYSDKKGVSVFCENFFDHLGRYDLVIEQTFFCAISPSLRPQYAEKMHKLLNKNGRIIGVMFNRAFEKTGPPFGGSILEYHEVFKKYFKIQTMEECYNSIQARRGNEIFINLKKINKDDVIINEI